MAVRCYFTHVLEPSRPASSETRRQAAAAAPSQRGESECQNALIVDGSTLADARLF